MNAAAHIADTLPYYNKRELIVDDHSTDDIIRALKSSYKEHTTSYDQICKEFWKGNAGDTARCLFDFNKKYIRYVVESPEIQTVKSPGAIVNEKRGDCKHYSSFIVGVCQALQRQGYPIAAKFRFVSDEPERSVHHVFAVVNGDGNEYWVDPVLSSFDTRPVFFNTKDITMGVYKISGSAGTMNSANFHATHMDDMYIYGYMTPPGMGAMNDAKNYKNAFDKQYGDRSKWAVSDYQNALQQLTAIRQDTTVPHDKQWGAQMFSDDVLNKELSALVKKTGGPERYSGFVQIDVGPGGTIYSYPVKSKTPDVPMPNIPNTTLIWAPLGVKDRAAFYSWRNKYPPKQGVAKEVQKVGKDIVTAVNQAKHFMLMTTQFASRNAFLALVDANAFNLATRLAAGAVDPKKRPGMEDLWVDKLGGDMKKLIAAINNGLHAKAFHHKQPAPKNISGISRSIVMDDRPMIGEALSLAALTALATAIIAAMSKFFGRSSTSTPGGAANGDDNNDQDDSDLSAAMSAGTQALAALGAGSGGNGQTQIPLGNGMTGHVSVDPQTGNPVIAVTGNSGEPDDQVPDQMQGQADGGGDDGNGTPGSDPHQPGSDASLVKAPGKFVDHVAKGVSFDVQHDLIDPVKDKLEIIWTNYKTPIIFAGIGIGVFKFITRKKGRRRK